jgi:hypothetical protein
MRLISTHSSSRHIGMWHTQISPNAAVAKSCTQVSSSAEARSVCDYADNSCAPGRADTLSES